MSLCDLHTPSPNTRPRPPNTTPCGAEAEGVADDELLHDEGPTEPGHGVLQGDEAHEVKVELGVVPGAGVELAQDEAGGELPQVGPERVDDAAQEQRAAAAQPQVHALHDEYGGAVDKEGPHARDPWELPVQVHHELPGRREHHLAEVAMDGVQVPAGQRRQGLGRRHGADWGWLRVGTRETGEGRTRWLMPVIPALWEAEADRLLEREVSILPTAFLDYLWSVEESAVLVHQSSPFRGYLLISQHTYLLGTPFLPPLLKQFHVTHISEM
ncbi:hypothetical protein AAY473_028400 [Plecturocebus cupreus]